MKLLVFLLTTLDAACWKKQRFCSDITSKVSRTNDWPTCRSCFNIRVEFNLNDYPNGAEFTNKDYLYLAFKEEVRFHKAAHPVKTIQKLGLDSDGNIRYKVEFKDRVEFGNRRIDFNAEFEQMFWNPVLVWARSCPCGGTELTYKEEETVYNPCNPDNISYMLTGGTLKNDRLQCKQKRKSRMTKCSAICADGSLAKPTSWSKCYHVDGKSEYGKEFKKGVWFNRSLEDNRARSPMKINCSGLRYRDLAYRADRKRQRQQRLMKV